jgi:hypothetical protein
MCVSSGCSADELLSEFPNLIVCRTFSKSVLLILLYMCPHTTIYVSSILYVSSMLLYMRPHPNSSKPQRLPHLFQVSTTDTTTYVSSILLCMCPQYYYMRLIRIPQNLNVCRTVSKSVLLILLHMCPQFYYICVLNATIYASSSEFLKTSTSAAPFPSQYY